MLEVKNREIRVLVADDEARLAERLVDLLQENGFDTRHARSGSEVRELLRFWRPDFVIYDMMLTEMNGLTFLHLLKNADLLGADKMKVFVMSGHNNPTNVKECLKLGASDYLVKPVAHQDILARLMLHIRARGELTDLSAKPSESQSGAYYMHLSDLVLRDALKGGTSVDRLFNITGLLSVSMKAVRVSVVRAEFETRQGWVMGSSDKRDIGGLEIDLGKYPEILYALRHDKLLAIDNLANDPTMHFTAKLTKSIDFNSMIVCPIRVEGAMWGVLSIRMNESKERLTDLEIRYAQLVAHVCGLIACADPALKSRSSTPPPKKADPKSA